MKTVAIYLGGTPSDGGTYQNALSLVSALATFPAEEYRVLGYCRDDVWPGILSRYGIESRVARSQGPASRLVTKVARELPLPLALRKRIGSLAVPFGRQLRRDDVDLCIYPNFEHYAWELSTPSLGAIHDLMHRYEPHFPEVASGDIPAARDRLFSRMRRGATGVLVDSEVGRRQVIESYGPDGAELHVLPYVAPAYIYEAAEREMLDGELDAWADAVGLPPKYLLYPAQFWMHKNHLRLLEALARLLEVHPEAHLVLVGSEKNAVSAVGETIERLGLRDSVSILGYVSNEQMAYLYRHARALVLPTFFGPTNIPPLEAFVLGCPVAVSGIYGMPEQVGDAALTFDPSSVDEIAGACLRLWEDDALCDRLRVLGYERARRWGPPEFAARLREIVDALSRGAK
ncbi:MAG: glycosyltransferase family 4 protein [Coriobacteriia bacterium]|nr:glycosyltransferase family 4 protein [Coriobacteriia bacterium]